MRRAVITGVIGGLGLIAASAAISARPPLIWNSSASAPLGLWAACWGAELAQGDWALALPSPAQAAWLRRRPGAPVAPLLIKQVAVIAPADICRIGAGITIRGAAVASALARDRGGRLLPRWEGCVALGPDQVLLLNTDPRSLDGRYFGPSSRAALVARLTPLWTWERV